MLLGTLYEISVPPYGIYIVIVRIMTTLLPGTLPRNFRLNSKALRLPNRQRERVGIAYNTLAPNYWTICFLPNVKSA